VGVVVEEGNEQGGRKKEGGKNKGKMKEGGF
jgi:hypothetical protein